MGEKKFTFIELHLDGDTQFGPKEIGEAAPFGTTSDTDEAVATDDEDAAAADEEGGKGAAVGVVLALIALVAIAIGVKKLRGGDDESELEEQDEPDIIVS
ncbi:hypothetical protein [Natronosalvus vescus]|uniref:hypothetical protein n=1 Tax=Natronosalvus vescus TaxID=2953881 RepID=UPI0020911D9F|nr:hypothetical protein [Natronosalvus vescus]